MPYRQQLSSTNGGVVRCRSGILNVSMVCFFPLLGCLLLLIGEVPSDPKSDTVRGIEPVGYVGVFKSTKQAIKPSIDHIKYRHTSVFVSYINDASGMKNGW